MIRRDSRARNGVTLLELVVALALGGMILAGAHAVLAALTDESHAIAVRSATADAAANGERELRDLAGRLEIGGAGDLPFTGAPGEARFTSWCDVPAGWLERCAVTLAFDTVDGTHALVARIDHDPPLALVRGLDAGTLRYLNSASNGGQWFRVWGTGITAPLALGVIVERDHAMDTLIVRIGPRG